MVSALQDLYSVMLIVVYTQLQMLILTLFTHEEGCRRHVQTSPPW
jgi:hypothetical protein